MSDVLHLRSSIGLYGAEHMLLSLCDEQARRGSAPLLAGFEHGPDLLEAARARGVPTLSLACRGPIDLRCIRRLRAHLQAVAKERPHVLHCHDYKSVTYGALAAAGLGLRLVATMHGWLQDDARVRLYRLVESRLLRGFERVCAVSDAIADRLVQSGVDEARVRRIDNGIDTRRFRPRDPAPSTRLRIGCAARLSPEKGLDGLLQAVAECDGLDLTIHGEGEMRPQLEAQVQRLGLQGRVRLPGNSDALEAWYPQLDAFVLPSLTEGMPLTVLEALSCGTPVIASAVGAVPAMLQGLPGCHVVPPGDIGALVAHLKQLQPRAAACEALHRHVAQRYSVGRMADDYDRVYDEALAA